MSLLAPPDFKPYRVRENAIGFTPACCTCGVVLEFKTNAYRQSGTKPRAHLCVFPEYGAKAHYLCLKCGAALRDAAP